MYLLAVLLLLFCIISGTLFLKDFESWDEEKKKGKVSWGQLFTITIWLFLYIGSIIYLMSGFFNIIMN